MDGRNESGEADPLSTGCRFEADGYTGALSPIYAAQETFDSLREVLNTGSVLRRGRHTLYRVQLELGGVPCDLAIKSFGRENSVKTMIDRFRGSKASRSFKHAWHLHEQGVGTPEPIGFVERWQGLSLECSYFITRFVDDCSDYREELLRLYEEAAPCSQHMDLMQVVAEAVRDMHRAGFLHRDLGNQNIFVRERSPGFWGDVQFIDLNRGRIKTELSVNEQARDVSRISLPSDFKRVFIEMMFAPDTPPENMKPLERRYRLRFGWHTRSRKFRHLYKRLLPSYHRRKKEAKAKESNRDYPAPREQFVWDDRSAQPVSVLVKKDRKSFKNWSNYAQIFRHIVGGLWPVVKETNHLVAGAFEQAVDLQGRVALSISGKGDRFDRECALLEELGPIPVHVRFYHHETKSDWEAGIGAVQALRQSGREVSIALVQDRGAVSDPESWHLFCDQVLAGLHEDVAFVEVGHAINRVKWGIWFMHEFRTLMQPIKDLQEKYPKVVFSGPAVIDFEFHYLAAALRMLPKGVRLGQQSIHLYVDRRGAPENRQGAYATLEKLAMARAIGRWSGGCEDHLVVSEVNWPLKDTGVYSPVVSPYESPGVRFDNPSVSEEDYADFMIRYLLIALCSGLAEKVCWWQLVARGYGLVDDTNEEAWRQRPAFRALRGFLQVVGSARFTGKADAPAGVHYYEFEQGAERRVIAYAEQEQKVSVPFGYVAVHDLEGHVMDCDGERIVLDGHPLVFTLQ